MSSEDLSNCIVIKWKAKGYYLNVYPADFFSKDLNGEKVWHYLYKNIKDSSPLKVSCYARISGVIAELDYSCSPDFNDVDIDKGVMTITFSDSNRSDIDQIQWKNSIGKISKDKAYHFIYHDDSIRQVEEGRRYLSEAVWFSRNSWMAMQRKITDDFSCQACGYRVKVGDKYIVDCHHKNMVSNGERIAGIDDLLTLCPNCHRIAHTSDQPLDLQGIKDELKKAGVQVIINK